MLNVTNSGVPLSIRHCSVELVSRLHHHHLDDFVKGEGITFCLLRGLESGCLGDLSRDPADRADRSDDDAVNTLSSLAHFPSLPATESVPVAVRAPSFASVNVRRGLPAARCSSSTEEEPCDPLSLVCRASDDDSIGGFLSDKTPPTVEALRLPKPS